MRAARALARAAALLIVATFAVVVAAAQKGPVRGRAVFEQACAACHEGGMGGAPALADQENWRRRMQQGEAALIDHALQGIRAMPARGGNAMLSDAEVAAAVRYMTARAAKAGRR
jgi:cytochrome c5